MLLFVVFFYNLQIFRIKPNGSDITSLHRPPAAPATQHVALERPAEPALACIFTLKKSSGSDITSRFEPPVQLVVQVVSMLPIARLKQPTCRYCFMCRPPAAPATRHVALERPAEPAFLVHV